MISTKGVPWLIFIIPVAIHLIHLHSSSVIRRITVRIVVVSTPISSKWIQVQSWPSTSLIWLRVVTSLPFMCVVIIPDSKCWMHSAAIINLNNLSFSIIIFFLNNSLGILSNLLHINFFIPSIWLPSQMVDDHMLQISQVFNDFHHVEMLNNFEFALFHDFVHLSYKNTVSFWLTDGHTWKSVVTIIHTSLFLIDLILSMRFCVGPWINNHWLKQVSIIRPH